MGLACALLRLLVREYPEGWDTRKLVGLPSFKRIVDWEMYPRKRKEEIIFWIDAVNSLINGLLWLPGFGVIAFMHVHGLRGIK